MRRRRIAANRRCCNVANPRLSAKTTLRALFASPIRAFRRSAKDRMVFDPRPNELRAAPRRGVPPIQSPFGQTKSPAAARPPGATPRTGISEFTPGRSSPQAGVSRSRRAGVQQSKWIELTL